MITKCAELSTMSVPQKTGTEVFGSPGKNIFDCQFKHGLPLLEVLGLVNVSGKTFSDMYHVINDINWPLICHKHNNEFNILV